jgi:hypothetical protein
MLRTLRKFNNENADKFGLPQFFQAKMRHKYVANRIQDAKIWFFNEEFSVVVNFLSLQFSRDICYLPYVTNSGDVVFDVNMLRTYKYIQLVERFFCSYGKNVKA